MPNKHNIAAISKLTKNELDEEGARSMALLSTFEDFPNTILASYQGSTDELIFLLAYLLYLVIDDYSSSTVEDQVFELFCSYYNRIKEAGAKGEIKHYE